jgi:polyisoprenoid-binding protein YceI
VLKTAGGQPVSKQKASDATVAVVLSCAVILGSSESLSFREDVQVNHSRVVVGRAIACVVVLTAATVLFSANLPLTAAQGQPAQGRGQAAAPPPVGPVTLEVVPGTRASYRVTEQFVGINFPSDAVGATETVTGTLYLNADGTIDSAKSKMMIDLRTLKSDQDMRDNYLRTRTFEVEKAPMVEFVPKRIQGVPSPLPVQGQAGFQLTGDMTVKGTTSEVTWNGIATFSQQQVAGRASTNFDFAKFGLAKPAIGRLMSVDDKIVLELEFRLKRS